LNLLQCQLLWVQTGELVGSILLAGYEGSHGEVLASGTERYVGGEKKKRERRRSEREAIGYSERMMERGAATGGWLASQARGAASGSITIMMVPKSLAGNM
jgi:hypothetical protein